MTLQGELILHVGFQQTGASRLLRALDRLRPQLRRHGIGLVGHSALTQLDALGGWEAEESPDPAAISAFDAEFAAMVEGEAAEVAQRSRGGVRAVVVSSDHLLGRDNVDGRDGQPFRHRAEAAVAQTIRATGADRVRVVLYTRRQDRLMEFCYLREIQNGGCHSFAQQFPRRFEPLLDYGELVGRLERLTGVEEVRVRPFELVGSSASRHVEDFLATLGLDGRLDLAPAGTNSRPYHMYSRRALQLALDVNEFLESERERRLVRQFLKEHFPGVDDESTRFLATQERTAILEAYAPVNRKLFERHLPDLPADAYASDEATHRLAEVHGHEPASGRGARSLRSPARRLRRWEAAGQRFVTATGRHARGRAAVARARWSRRRTLPSPVDQQVPHAEVVVVSFPQCGGAWLRLMLGSVLARQDGRDARGQVKIARALLGDMPLPPFLLGVRARAARGLPVPGARDHRVVVLARDPHDVAVARSVRQGRPRGRTLLSPRPKFLGESAGGLEWLLAAYDTWAEERRLHPQQVMLVRFEDLHGDPETVLRRVLEFAGVDSVDERSLQEAVAVSRSGELDFPTAQREPDASRPDGVARYADRLSDADMRRIDEHIGRSLGAAAFGYGPDPAGSPEPARSRVANDRRDRS